MLYCVFMGVVQNYPRLPFRHAFANLSSPFALNQNRGREVLAYGPYLVVCMSHTKGSPGNCWVKITYIMRNFCSMVATMVSWMQAERLSMKYYRIHSLFIYIYSILFAKPRPFATVVKPASIADDSSCYLGTKNLTWVFERSPNTPDMIGSSVLRNRDCWQSSAPDRDLDPPPQDSLHSDHFSQSSGKTGKKCLFAKQILFIVVYKFHENPFESIRVVLVVLGCTR